MDYVSAWLDQLGYQGSENLVSPADDFRGRPYSAELGDLFSLDRQIGASHVYCIDGVPITCFFNLDGKPDGADAGEWASSLRRKLWNQGLATVVIILEPEALAAFPVLQNEQGPRRLSLDDASPVGPWSAFDFSSSAVQQRQPDWFDPTLKVDQTLLRNLREVVDSIKGPTLSRETAEALLAQVIFIRYLESRGIVGDRYRDEHGLFEIETLLKKGDGASIGNMIGTLAETFNGDFLNSHAETPPPWESLEEATLRTICKFLSGEDMRTGQRSLWGYDFSLIPVELLSSIYETFLAERQKEQGAYYTPRHLATMAVEEAFRTVKDPHRARVFDGACGSGILLTTAFQRMLASAELARGRSLSFKERTEILTSQVYGADIDSTACWITAFSLYLCLLDRLTPADVQLLQEDEGTKLPPLVSATGKGNILTGPGGDFFYAAGAPELADVLISNPPWREARGKKKEPFEEHVASEFDNPPIPDRQIAAAYAYKASHRVRPGGIVTLILPLNLILGLESFGFRQRLLELIDITRIINFADLRHVLFPNAKNACALVVGTVRDSANGPIIKSDDTIEYLTPRADRRAALGVVSVAQNDRAFISSLEVYNSPPIFIRRTWGRDEDLALLSRMEEFGRLRDVINRRGWISNKGFHKTDRNNPSLSLDDPALEWLANLPFLATKRMPKGHSYVAEEGTLPKVRDVMPTVATPGGAEGKLYAGPRVIWRNGLSRDLRIRAFFSERRFAFQHTACAIGAPHGEADMLRLLAVYLRSDLATYLINLTSFSAIADRQAVSKTEVLNLPFMTADSHPDPRLAQRVLKKVREFYQLLADVEEWQRDRVFEERIDWLNATVFEYFGIGGHEAELVRQTAQTVSPSVQPTSYKGLNNPLNSSPSQEMVGTYLDALLESLNGWRVARNGKGHIGGTIHTSHESPQLGLVKISAGATAVTSENDAAWNVAKWFSTEEHSVQKQTLLETPDLMIASGPDIYLVKPMQARYWGTRAAFADTNRILAGIDAVAHRPQ